MACCTTSCRSWEGETLRARLVAEQQLPVDETIRLITILAGALDFAHAARVGHLALGFAYVVASAWDKAEEAYKRAIALDSRSVDAHDWAALSDHGT